MGAIDMPKTSGHLLVRLKMEKDKLIGWAILAGISEEEAQLKPAMRFNRHTIIDTLKEIETLLLDVARLKSLYNLEFSIAEGSSKTGIEPPSSQTSGNTPVPDRYARLEKRALVFFEKTRKVPRRLRWSALDNDKFEELLANLGRLNDGMISFLESYDREKLLKKQEITLMQVLQVSTKVDDLLALLNSQEMVNAQFRHHLRSLSLDSGQKYAERFERLTRFRTLNLAVELGNTDHKSLSPLIEDTRLSLEGLELETLKEAHTPEQFSCGLYEGQSVWVEWRYYEPQVEDRDEEDEEGMEDSREPPALAHRRIAQMAKLLRAEDKPPEFRVPDCVGYVLDANECRLGLIYKPINVSAQTTQQLVSLLSLLSEMKKPSLTARIQIGRLLASSIWYLHAMQWLHKGLRSQKIVFEGPVEFRNAQNAEPPRLFLCGFDYSRPAATDETTERPTGNPWHDLYRHPNTQFDFPREGRRGFRKLYDVYSLG
ncbi:hypothetical protein PG985_012746 [Apiospora marii]|uniref:uncharacterized protein n=1 Tax=Apiospora marii TaxID=335849 RepID=UPI00312F61F1